MYNSLITIIILRGNAIAVSGTMHLDYTPPI